MIELAKQNVPEAEYKVEDMTHLKNGEYKIDAVVSFYAIFHTPSETHQELLHKINSFLNQSGYLLITIGSSEWEGKEQDFHGAEMFWSHYDSRKNREMVEEAGFEIIVDAAFFMLIQIKLFSILQRYIKGIKRKMRKRALRL